MSVTITCTYCQPSHVVTILFSYTQPEMVRYSEISTFTCVRMCRLFVASDISCEVEPPPPALISDQCRPNVGRRSITWRHIFHDKRFLSRNSLSRECRTREEFRLGSVSLTNVLATKMSQFLRIRVLLFTVRKLGKILRFVKQTNVVFLIARMDTKGLEIWFKLSRIFELKCTCWRKLCRKKIYVK